MAYWDPVTGTYKEGDPPEGYKPPGSDAVPGGSATSVYQRGKSDPRQWGGYGRATDANGKPIVGSSGGERDVARYRGMAKSANTTPIIDQTRSNETRGYQDRALGYLGSAAQGQGLLSRRLGEQQANAAANAATSLAASVRGGPMARAAAARRVNQDAGGLAARARMATDAAAAAEEAGARGAYMSGTTTQRAQDLGLATSQAGLELGQRQADDQREGFYEGLGFDTANTQLETGLGVSRSDQAAGASQRQAARDAIAQGDRNTQDYVNASVGGATGLAQAASKKINPPDDKYGTSDIKAKTDVADVDSLKKRAQHGIDTTRAALEAGPYIGMKDSAGMGKEALDDAIGRRVAADAAPTYGYFDENQKPAPPDWLATYMNGPEQLALSDDKTKLAKAWDEGHAAAIADVEKASRASPEEIKRRSEGDGYVPAYATARDIKARAWDEGNKEGVTAARMAAVRKKLQDDFDAAGKDPPVGPPPDEPRVTPAAPAAPVAGPGYVSQILGRARAMLPSDERTKESKGYVPGAMADALRSMKPSVYEYKPEYAGRAGQEQGEKNVGPMANPMAKDPVASTAIERQPDGMLAIDKDKALKLALGGLADLQFQVDDLKRKKGKAA